MVTDPGRPTLKLLFRVKFAAPLPMTFGKFAPVARRVSSCCRLNFSISVNFCSPPKDDATDVVAKLKRCHFFGKWFIVVFIDHYCYYQFDSSRNWKSK